MYKFYHKIWRGAAVWHFNQPTYLNLEYFFNEFFCNQIVGPAWDEGKKPNQKVLMMVYVTGHGYIERNPNAGDFKNKSEILLNQPLLLPNNIPPPRNPFPIE